MYIDMVFLNKISAREGGDILGITLIEQCTCLFFILFHRFLFQLAHLLLDAFQHRVRANGSLDYAFRWLGDAFLNFGFLNFGFLGSHIFLW